LDIYAKNTYVKRYIFKIPKTSAIGRNKPSFFLKKSIIEQYSEQKKDFFE